MYSDRLIKYIVRVPDDFGLCIIFPPSIFRSSSQVDTSEANHDVSHTSQNVRFMNYKIFSTPFYQQMHFVYY